MHEVLLVDCRQLAVLLRGALSMKTKDSFREVYCWQTISSLELWAKLLATHADKEVRLPGHRSDAAPAESCSCQSGSTPGQLVQSVCCM